MALTKGPVKFGAGDLKILSESFVFINTCDINHSSYAEYLCAPADTISSTLSAILPKSSKIFT
jgi:hypothetical protein